MPIPFTYAKLFFFSSAILQLKEVCYKLLTKLGAAGEI